MKFKHLVSGFVAVFALSGFASAALLVGYNGTSLTVADSGSTWGDTGATSTFTTGGYSLHTADFVGATPNTVHNTYGSGGLDLGGAIPDANVTNQVFYYDHMIGSDPNHNVNGPISPSVMALQWTITNGNTHSLVLDNLYYDIGRGAVGGFELTVEKYDSSNQFVEALTPITFGHAIGWSEHANALNGLSLDVSEKLVITWMSTHYADYAFDNLALSGSFTSLIPEPGSAFALAGLLGSGLLLRNRRRAA